MGIWSEIEIDCRMLISRKVSVKELVKGVLDNACGEVERVFSPVSSCQDGGFYSTKLNVRICEGGSTAAQIVSKIVEAIPCDHSNGESLDVYAGIWWVK